MMCFKFSEDVFTEESGGLKESRFRCYGLVMSVSSID